MLGVAVRVRVLAVVTEVLEAAKVIAGVVEIFTFTFTAAEVATAAVVPLLYTLAVKVFAPLFALVRAKL